MVFTDQFKHFKKNIFSVHFLLFIIAPQNCYNNSVLLDPVLYMTYITMLKCHEAFFVTRLKSAPFCY